MTTSSSRQTKLVRALAIWLACMALGAAYVASRPSAPPGAHVHGGQPPLRIDDWVERQRR
jgi:hypothetical protein